MHDRSSAPDQGGVNHHRALAEAIRSARGQMTQVRLAERVGSPQSSISLWENGRATPSLEQVHLLEAALDLPAGHLLLAGGYIDSGFCSAHFRSDRPTRAAIRWKPARGTPGSFPERTFMWLDTFRPVIEAICVLRSTAYDDHALNALLDSAPVVQLRLGWEIWRTVDPAAADDPEGTMAAVIGRTALNKCRYALWGIESLRPVPDLPGGLAAASS